MPALVLIATKAHPLKGLYGSIMKRDQKKKLSFNFLYWSTNTPSAGLGTHKGKAMCSACPGVYPLRGDVHSKNRKQTELCTIKQQAQHKKLKCANPGRWPLGSTTEISSSPHPAPTPTPPGPGNTFLLFLPALGLASVLGLPG